MSPEGLESYKVRWICPVRVMLLSLCSVLLLAVGANETHVNAARSSQSVDKINIVMNNGS